MSHQRQMESSRKRPPEEWRGYQRLGVAVIASAVQDLKKPMRAGKESVWARESARAFLTVSNPNLTFWCGVADVDMNAILRKYWPDVDPC
jgi:hypothetical protein